MLVFDHDEEGYAEWLEANPHGFVLNSYRRPKRGYLILHRAACKSVSRTAEPPVRWTTSDFIKVCATNVVDIEAWCRKETGGNLQPCGMCHPQAPSR
jgi:hypothetical protein